MDYSKYENKMVYPSSLRFICKECGYVYPGRNLAIKVNFCSDCGAPVKEHFEFLIAERKEKLSAWNKEDSRLIELFKNDILEYNGLTNHPRKDVIFNYAWDKGSSSGYECVADVLDELCELF